MTTISTQNILFDDFALLEKHISRQRLTATSVNADCDCASSPVLNTNCDCASSVSPASDCDRIGYFSTSHYDDRDSD